MTQEPLASRPGFMTAVLDALPAQTAVVNGHDTIVAVNVAWSRFMTERGGEHRDRDCLVLFSSARPAAESRRLVQR